MSNKQLDQKNEEDKEKEDKEKEDSQFEETDEKLIKNEADQPVMSRVKLELTPRDVLLILYQSRLHSSNVQIGERSLDLMKRCGYTCDHLTEVSYTLQKQNSEKSNPDGNIQNELPEFCQEEEITMCSQNEQKNLRQALVDICLSWIPSKAFQQGKGENDSSFDETLELVMSCLCEDAASTTPLSSIIDILHWIQTQLDHWNSAITAITLNTSQGNLPVFFESLLSLHARLLSIPDVEQSANEIGTSSSATAGDLQKPVLEALYLLSNICRTLSEKYGSFEGSGVSKPKVLQPFLEQIAAEYQT